MAELAETYMCVPSTERGRGILISGNSKSNSIIYCNGRSVIICSLDLPLKPSVYGEHSYTATVARFSPNGEWIASADVSGTVRIWGAHNQFALKNEFKVLSGRIDDLQWSPDGMRIVASGDGKGKSLVRAFMWDSGTNVGEFDGHSRRVLSCDFKPTRPFRIVTCGEDFLVNIYEGPPFKFKLSHRDHSNFVNCVRFCPDGSKFISVSSDKKGIMFDGKTGERIGQLLSEDDGHKGSIYAVSWSPDGRHVVTVSADKSAKIWEICDKNGKLTKTMVCPECRGGVDNMLVGCIWLNDSIVTVSLGGTICIFPTTDVEKSPVVLSGHMKNVTSLVTLKSETSVLLLSSSFDGHIVKWARGVGYQGRLERKQTTQIKCLAALGQRIVASGFDNKIWMRSLNGGGADEEWVDIGSQPRDLGLAGEQLVLVSTATGLVLLRESSVVYRCEEVGFSVTASVLCPDGREAIVGGEDGKLHIYSIQGDNLTKKAVINKHRGAITVIRYSPDLSMFASADVNREAVVWDSVSHEVKVKNMLYHSARINCVAWSTDSKRVATGSLDTSVIIYNVDQPASTRATIKGAHLGGVYALTFLDDYNLVSSGEDAFVRIWTLPLIH